MASDATGPVGVFGLEHLRQVMTRLRRECPWDAEQTHLSLVSYLVEECSEVVDAIEELGPGQPAQPGQPGAADVAEVADAAGGSAAGVEDLREELGDLLLQVFFHAQIEADLGNFDIDDVAEAISQKLVRRHPHVFAGQDVPDDLDATWEARKRAEKGRTSSLDGIAASLGRMSGLARAHKVVARVRRHQVAVDLPDAPIDADELGRELLRLAARAEASGIDPDQVLRRAVTGLEQQVRAAEAASS